MTIAAPPPPSWKKSPPLFPSNLPLKVEFLSIPPFLKIWLEVQPPLPCRGGGVHYVVPNRTRYHICKSYDFMFFKKDHWTHWNMNVSVFDIGYSFHIRHIYLITFFLLLPEVNIPTGFSQGLMFHWKYYSRSVEDNLPNSIL